MFVETSASLKSLPKPFKFFRFWIHHPCFDEILEEAWRSIVTSTHPLIRVCQKLKNLQRKLNREEFSDIKERVKEKEEEVQQVQKLALNDPSTTNFEAERKMGQELKVLMDVEECFYKQKSRECWLKTGDMNSVYFHRSVRSKQKKCTIRMLRNESGDQIHDVEGMAHIAFKFYESLLGVVDPEVVKLSDSYFDDLLKHKFNEEQLGGLCNPFTDDQIKAILFAMDGDKSPGPDGFSAAFFQYAWPFIGAEVTSAIKFCFEQDRIPRRVNATILSLVPKVPNLDEMKYFRPILLQYIV
ncbi:unnamed protein product [Linum trigynum]|uniref:Reverse transcriptase n=1 Tax=Linum trigynum TaxID=586398 RepID=A0AAV2GTR1_9ROSI